MPATISYSLLSLKSSATVSSMTPVAPTRMILILGHLVSLVHIQKSLLSQCLLDLGEVSYNYHKCLEVSSLLLQKLDLINLTTSTSLEESTLCQFLLEKSILKANRRCKVLRMQ